MVQIEAVCWDIDGVLVDTEPLHKEKLMAVATGHGICLTEEDWPTLHGIGDKRAWEWLRQSRGLAISQEQFLSECEEYYMAHPEMIVPRTGAQDVFNYFASLSLPQCAVSSGIKTQVDTNLAISGVSDRMLFALSADEVKKTKPDPEPYLIGKSRLCERLGWEETAMEGTHFLAIEDSVPGVVSAKRAGIPIRRHQRRRQASLIPATRCQTARSLRASLTRKPVSSINSIRSRNALPFFA